MNLDFYRNNNKYDISPPILSEVQMRTHKKQETIVVKKANIIASCGLNNDKKIVFILELENKERISRTEDYITF